MRRIVDLAAYIAIGLGLGAVLIVFANRVLTSSGLPSALRTIESVRALWVGVTFTIETSVLLELIDHLLPWLLRLRAGQRHH